MRLADVVPGAGSPALAAEYRRQCVGVDGDDGGWGRFQFAAGDGPDDAGKCSEGRSGHEGQPIVIGTGGLTPSCPVLSDRYSWGLWRTGQDKKCELVCD